MGDSDIGSADFIISREVDGETLVLDGRKDLVHRLNPTASFIWQRSQSGDPAEDIATALADAYDVEIGAASRDVTTTLHRLKELDLVPASASATTVARMDEQHEQA